MRHIAFVIFLCALVAMLAWDRWECHQHGGCYRVTGDQMKVMVRQVVEQTVGGCKRGGE